MRIKLLHTITILALLQVLFVAAVFAQTDKTPSSDGANTAGAYEENLRRWKNMSEEQRQAIRQKVRATDPRQRGLVRQNARMFRQLPPEEQERVRNNFQRFKELPNEKREMMRQRTGRFQRFPPEEKARLRREIREERAGRKGGRIGFVQGPDNVKRNDPSGPRNGPGTNLRRPAGAQGGPGTGPGLRSPKRQGPGAGQVNRSGAKMGRSGSNGGRGGSGTRGPGPRPGPGRKK